MGAVGTSAVQCVEALWVTLTLATGRRVYGELGRRRRDVDGVYKGHTYLNVSISERW